MSISASLDAALGFNVNRLAMLFRRQLIRALRAYRLTPEQWQILAAVVEADGDKREVSQTALAQLTLKDRHAVSRMIDRMALNGWIRKHSHSGDARAFHIRPTDKAVREFPKVRATLFDAFQPVFKRVPLAQRDQLLLLCKTMSEAFAAPAGKKRTRKD